MPASPSSAPFARSRRTIRRALQKTRGNRTALLEISHRSLLYKIKDYAIDPDAEGRKGRGCVGAVESCPRPSEFRPFTAQGCYLPAR
jgi:hypothetical protein